MSAAYDKSHLAALARDLEALTKIRFLVGDPEDTRALGTKRTALLRHPTDGRDILEYGPVVDHRAETAPFGEITEHCDLIIVAPDYASAVAAWLTIIRDGVLGMTQVRHGLKWLSALSMGNTRRPRPNEVLPQGIPAGYFVLVSTFDFVWLAESQDALYGAADSLEATADLTNSSNVVVGQTTIPEEIP